MDPFEQDWAQATRLRAHLSAGHPLARVPCVLEPHEPACYAHVAVAVDRLVGFRLAIPTSDPRTHAAAQHWEWVDGGELHLTASRFLVCRPDGSSVSFGWSGLRSLDVEPEGLLLRYSGDSFRLRMHCPAWIAVAAFGLQGRAHEVRQPAWLEDA